MTANLLSIEDIEKARVSLEDVFLDTNNPRFHGENDFQLHNSNGVFDSKNQEVVRQYIVRKYGANEIIDSVLAVGFIPIDMVVLEKTSNDKYVVVEGNRRIAALKTIVGNISRKVLEVNGEILQSIYSFEALVIVKNSKNINLKKWILQGIRHVSGVRGWGPYQQAMLINELHYKHKMPFKDIGKTIGVHYNRVSTMLRAYLALEQMKGDNEYSSHADVNLFSHFEQAYIKKSLRDWLCWDEKMKKYTNIDNLKKFYNMIIGGDDKPVIMSKHIRDDLPGIMENSEIFEKLIDNKISLSEAKQLSFNSSISRNNTISRLTNDLIKVLQNHEVYNEEEKVSLSKLSAILDNMVGID